ncbi:unnamed protein product [Auanema sp. JU1783]|nr:unnamed protein product [Auanema sp. JU1783]
MRFKYSSETIAELSKSIDLDFDPPLNRRKKSHRRSLDVDIDLFGQGSRRASLLSDDDVYEESSFMGDYDTARVLSSTSPPYPLRTINENMRDQTSNDSICTTLLSTSLCSYRPQRSQISLDNSCFDLYDGTENCTSTVGTPVEKMFPKDMYSLYEKMDQLKRDISIQKEEIACFSSPDSLLTSNKNENIQKQNLSDEIELEPSTSLAVQDTIHISKQLQWECKSSSSSMNSIPDENYIKAYDPHTSHHREPSPVVRQCGGRLSIRYRKLKGDQAILLAQRATPPKLDLVVGGPGCASNSQPQFPPSPISPPPKDSLPLSQCGISDPMAAIPFILRPMSEKKQQIGRRCGNLRMIESLRCKVVSLKGLKGHGNKPIFLVAKLDHKDIHLSSPLVRETTDNVLDDFLYEGSNTFTNFHLVVLEGSRTPGKTPRPIGRISLNRLEIIKNTGNDMVLPLKAVSKCQEVQGQLCLDIRRDNGHFSLRVVDHSGLGLSDDHELYLLVSTPNTKQEAKLRIHRGRFSEEWLKIECDEGLLSIKMTLWHDLLCGLNSVYHGQVRVDVDDKWTNGPTKWFYLRPGSGDVKEGESTTVAVRSENIINPSLGEAKILITYTADHVFSAEVYQPLMSLLASSLTVNPFSASLISIMENLPKVDLGLLSRPLVQTFAYSRHLRPLLVALYITDIQKCQDYNTLFRSQTLATKMLYELLKIYGHSYLLVTLKPVIDKIYKERKCCEIDPARVNQGESVEKNATQLLLYFQMIFNRLMDSVSRCPLPIKNILADLRNVVAEKIGRIDVERLALSSFIIMRFFAAAILNPKHFGLKRDSPDSRVSRTLLLLSKMLQRLSNSCVSDQSLSTKEPWLSEVLTRITDDRHRCEMVRFLDRVSLYSNESCSSSDSIVVLKEGYLIETRSGARPAWRKMLHQKKRYVILTDMEIMWQKSHRGDLDPKGTIALTDIKNITLENKNILVLKTINEDEISFACNSIIEANDWFSIIDKQRARARRLTSKSELCDLFDSDFEREMESLHVLLVEHVNTLTIWKTFLEGNDTSQQNSPLPPELEGNHLKPEEREKHRTILLSTLTQILSAILTIESAHQEAIDKYMNTISKERGTRENPIGAENYMLLNRKLQLS